MELKYSQLSHLSQFSNDRLVRMISEKVAESENAALALVFDDKLVIIDEDTNDFYSVDYNIRNRALNLENWEKIDLLPDDKTRINELSGKLFDPTNKEEIRAGDLAEAFRLANSEGPIKQIVNESISKKKSITESNAKIKAVSELRKVRGYFKDDISEIMEDLKVQTIKEQISENSPTQSMISRIDFRRPLSVSLFEEDSDKVVNLSEKKKYKKKSKNAKKKVQNMWTSESFKQDFKDMLDLVKEMDDPTEVMEKFLEQHRELLILSETEFGDLILKTALMIGEADTADSVVEGFTGLYNSEEYTKLREEYIERNQLDGETIIEQDEEDDEEDEEDMLDYEEGDETKKKTKKKKKESKDEDETTIDEDTINKLIKVFGKIQENLKEKTLERRYVENLIETLEDAKVGSISEGRLKEIVDFLDSVYSKSKEQKEEDR
jgi:hypothetical protein